jgi:hypothetical protein
MALNLSKYMLRMHAAKVRGMAPCYAMVFRSLSDSGGSVTYSGGQASYVSEYGDYCWLYYML